MNKRPYAQPGREPPKKDTLLACILVNSPTEAFVCMEEICKRVGRNKSSIPPLVNIALNRGYLERANPPWIQPQMYRLSQEGRKLKYAYGD